MCDRTFIETYGLGRVPPVPDPPAPADQDMMKSRAGDLLFFSDRVDGHITHVAIALGSTRIVHLALGRGGYAVEKLDDERDPYVAKLRERFVKARRVLTPALLIE